jgi:hypothetical protein
MDLTNMTNVSSLQGVAVFTNDMTGGILFNGAMLVFFIIILVVLTKNDEPFENALAVASWSMFIISAFFWFAELVPTISVLAFLFIAAFTTLYLYTSSR